jgi:hypothetical protein
VTYGEIEVVRNGKPREAEPKKEAEGAKDAANKGEAAK